MLELAGEIADGVLIHVGAAPGAIAWALERVEAGMARAGRARGAVRRIAVVYAMIDDDKARAVAHMRPCAASFCRHGHARDLLRLAGVPDPPPPPVPFPSLYPDLGHAVDWEAAKRVAAFVPDAVVEATLMVGSVAEVAERVSALAALDLDAVWWRDEASYTRPAALLDQLEKAVLPRLRSRAG